MSGIIEAKNCVKNFGGLAAVKDFSVEIKQGEIVGLIGPNGAGKTTFLNLVAGRFGLSSGDILFKGKSIARLKPYERVQIGIARTFQIPQPFVEMTVEENTLVGALFGRGHGGEAHQQKVHRVSNVLERVGLGNVKQRPASELNLAQLKRLELARALATDAEVLLLDEVMGGLNLKEVENMMDLIRKLNTEGKTIILVEHIMKVVMEISQRVIVMHHGQKLAEGEPHQVAADPRVIEGYMGKKFANRWGERTNVGS